jgi:hypothetical protein
LLALEQVDGILILSATQFLEMLCQGG